MKSRQQRLSWILPETYDPSYHHISSPHSSFSTVLMSVWSLKLSWGFFLQPVTLTTITCKIITALNWLPISARVEKWVMDQLTKHKFIWQETQARGHNSDFTHDFVFLVAFLHDTHLNLFPFYYCDIFALLKGMCRYVLENFLNLLWSFSHSQIVNWV